MITLHTIPLCFALLLFVNEIAIFGGIQQTASKLEGTLTVVETNLHSRSYMSDKRTRKKLEAAIKESNKNEDRLNLWNPQRAYKSKTFGTRLL